MQRMTMEPANINGSHRNFTFEQLPEIFFTNVVRSLRTFNNNLT